MAPRQEQPAAPRTLPPNPPLPHLPASHALLHGYAERGERYGDNALLDVEGERTVLFYVGVMFGG